MKIFFWVTVFLFCLTHADSIYVYKSENIGAYQNSVGCGGMARYSSADMMFANSAYLCNMKNNSTQISFNNFAQNNVPSVSSAGRFTKKSVFGIGYKEYKMDSLEEKQLFVSSAFSPTDVLWPGISVKYLFTQGGTSLDIDVGVIWNSKKNMRVSANLKNIIGSYIDSDKSIKRGRMGSLGFMYYWSEYSVGGINALLESSLNGKFYSGSMGLEKRFLTNSQTGLRVGYFFKSEDEFINGISMGTIFTRDIYEQTFSVEYSYKRLFKKEEPGEHFITLSAGIYGSVDRIPPEVFVETDLRMFSPDGDGINDKLTFRLRASDGHVGSGVKSWALIIYPNDLEKEQIKGYVGGGIPPSAIVWDGRDSKGNLVESGMYRYVFTAKDKKGNQSRTDWITIQVK